MSPGCLTPSPVLFPFMLPWSWGSDNLGSNPLHLPHGFLPPRGNTNLNDSLKAQTSNVNCYKSFCEYARGNYTLCITLKHLCLLSSISYGSCYISLFKTTPFPIRHFFCTLVRETSYLQKVCLHVFSCKEICFFSLSFYDLHPSNHSDEQNQRFSWGTTFFRIYRKWKGENKNLLFFCITYFFSEHLLSV